MLKTFAKFVLQRCGRAQHPPGQVVKDDYATDPASASESLPQPTEPQLDEPSPAPVSGKVKWYNSAKRYGFVELADGSGDAFLHATVLAAVGIIALQTGETLELRVAPGQRGLTVTEVISVDIAAPQLRRGCRERGRGLLQTDRRPKRASKRWGR